MRYFFVFFFLVLTNSLFSQTGKSITPQYIPSNVERYQVDYELKNISNPSADLLLQLNIDQFDALRQDSVDVEVNDPQHNVVIILYSVQKCMQRKSVLPQYIEAK